MFFQKESKISFPNLDETSFQEIFKLFESSGISKLEIKKYFQN